MLARLRNDKRFPSRYAVWLGLILIVGFAAFVRLRLLDLPLERDEGEYAYAGQLMLQGVPPYQLAYNMKLPGTYAAYAAIMAVFGQTPSGIHLGLILINSMTICLTYLLGQRLFGRICGLVAAAFFALLSLCPAVLGQAAHATHFVTFFAVAGTLLLWHATEKENTQEIFWSGLLFGLAFLMKQQGVFFGGFGAVVVLAHELQQRPMQLRRLLIWTAELTLGFLLPFAITCAVLALAGVFSHFWFWTFTYARQYTGITSLAHGWLNLSYYLPKILKAAPAMWVLSGVGLLLVILRKGDRRKFFFAIAFLLAALATIFPGFYFRHHYFIPVLPAFGIFAGAALEIVADEIGRLTRAPAARLIPVALFLAIAADTVYRQRAFFFDLSPDQASRSIYLDNPFPEAREIANYIRGHSAPESRIAVIGSEPEIYFYSQRHSATGFIYTYPLMEPHPFALTMQKDMIAEIEASNPEYVVLVSIPNSWLPYPKSDYSILDWFDKYTHSHLKEVGSVEVFSDRPAVYSWEKKTNPTCISCITVFKRRGSP